jgi:hypothetical protein
MRAQASIEFILILAVSLIILAGIAAIASERLSDVSTQKEFNDAKTAVRDLADASNSVYMQGVGARKNVYIVIPNDADLDNTLSYVGKPYGVGNETLSRTINIRLKGTDVFATTEVDVEGSFPSTSGGHWCWVQSFGTYVSVCTAFLDVAPTSIYVAMERSSSESETISITNEGNETADISLSFEWAHSDVTVNASSTSFSLAPYEDRNITITFSSNSNAVGIYGGMLVIDGNSSSMSDTVEAPISADVIVAGGVPCTPVNIDIGTYLDSNYSTAGSDFIRREDVLITGGDWTASSTVTVNIFLNSLGPGSPVSGYPKDVSTDGTGDFTDSWNIGGATAGVYNVSANQSGRSASYLFNVTGCG